MALSGITYLLINKLLGLDILTKILSPYLRYVTEFAVVKSYTQEKLGIPTTTKILMMSRLLIRPYKYNKQKFKREKKKSDYL